MRARDRLAALALALAVGCASQDGGEPPPAPPEAADTPSAPPVERLEAERTDNDAADDELGLAEYERLLAEKEDRLRAAGVLVAVREEQRRDRRFAEPPPPSGGLPADEEDVATSRTARSKKTAGGASMGGGGRAAATPRPAPTAPSRPSATAPRGDAAPKSAPTADANLAPEEEAKDNRCPTICDLSAATCDLEGKICDLAQRHPGEPRYADLCRRADDDCRLAAEACQRCSP